VDEIAADDESADIEMDDECPQYLKYIASLDPKLHKDQDHYKVLGLSKLRYQASDGQIRRACRFFVCNSP